MNHRTRQGEQGNEPHLQFRGISCDRQRRERADTGLGRRDAALVQSARAGHERAAGVRSVLAMLPAALADETGSRPAGATGAWSRGNCSTAINTAIRHFTRIAAVLPINSEAAVASGIARKRDQPAIACFGGTP